MYFPRIDDNVLMDMALDMPELDLDAIRDELVKFQQQLREKSTEGAEPAGKGQRLAKKALAKEALNSELEFLEEAKNYLGLVHGLLSKKCPEALDVVLRSLGECIVEHDRRIKKLDRPDNRFDQIEFFDEPE